MAAGGLLRLHAMAALPQDVYPDADEHRYNDARALHAVLQVREVHQWLQGHGDGRDADTRHDGERVRSVRSGRRGCQYRVACQVEHHPEDAETTLTSLALCHDDCNQSRSAYSVCRLAQH